MNKEKVEEEKKLRKEQLKAETEKWNQGDVIHQVCISRLEAVDSEFLSEKPKDLEKYLDDAIMDHVIKGLVEVAKTMPDDPIDALADFLFEEHLKSKNNKK